LNNYFEIEGLLTDWIKVEREFLLNFPPKLYQRSYEFLYKHKTERFSENVKKMMKLLKSQEDINKNLLIEEKEIFRKKYEISEFELKVLFLITNFVNSKRSHL
jgi:hypothetical protein